MKFHSQFFAVSALVMYLGSANTFAEDRKASARVIEEVIVTAQKREESVLDVPLTLTAFSESMIEELGITTANDLEQLVPGLQFGDNNEQVGQGTVIRGIGTRLSGETHSDLAVATYIDGVYTLGTYGVAPSFFDLQRVEVARGPQGTLNGRNSIAGSISYYTKKPTQEWDALVLTEFTDQFTQRYNAAFGGPLTDVLSFRISGGYFKGDGAQENIGLGDDYDAPDQISYSPQLRLQTDLVDMNLRYAHVRDKGAGRTQISLTQRDRTVPCRQGTTEDGDPDPLGPCTGVNPWFMYQGTIPSINANCPPGLPGFKCGDLKNKINFNRSSTQDSEGDQVFYYADVGLSDGLSLRYNLGWSEVVQRVNKDGDYTNRIGSAANPLLSADAGVPFNDLLSGVDYLYDERSHELQLISHFDGKFNFITGIFFYENDTTWSVPLQSYAGSFRFKNADTAAAAASPFYGFIPVSNCQDVLTKVASGFLGINTNPALLNEAGSYWGCPQGNDHTQFFLFSTNGKSKTRAAFVSVDYRFDERWFLSGGVRYTEDRKTQGFDGGFIIGEFLGAGVPLTIFFDDSDLQQRTWRQTIGNVSLQYTPADNMMVYGRVSTGYRAGGFNTYSPGAPTDPIEKETLINYELGLKGLFLDQRLQLTSAVFYNAFDDYQINARQEVPAQFQLPTSDSPLNEYTANIDGTKLWGAEIDVLYQMSDQFRVSGYYSYLDSKIGNFVSVIKGDPNPQTAPYTHIDLMTGLPTTSFYVLPKDQSGNELPQQAHHKGALTLTYTQPLNELGNLDLLTTWSYTGKRHADVANLPIYDLPAYRRWDIRATWTAVSEVWSATLYVQNILNEIGLVEFIPVSTNGPTNGASSGTLTDPRQIGLQLRWRPTL